MRSDQVRPRVRARSSPIGAVLVIDPGAFTERAALDGADAVLITHEHSDHLDVDALADALGRARRPHGCSPHAAVAPKLAAIAGAVTTVASGDRVRGGRVPGPGLRRDARRDPPGHPAGAEPRLPGQRRVYHPGDSFDVPEGATVDTLFVPISGPWLKTAESMDFVRAVAPRQAFAIHDGSATTRSASAWSTACSSWLEPDRVPPPAPGRGSSTSRRNRPRVSRRLA